MLYIHITEYVSFRIVLTLVSEDIHTHFRVVQCGLHGKDYFITRKTYHRVSHLLTHMQIVIRKLLTSLGYVHTRIVLTRSSLSSDKACLLIRDKRTLQLTHCKLVILMKARTHTAQLIKRPFEIAQMQSQTTIQNNNKDLN